MKLDVYGKKPFRGRARGQTRTCIYCGTEMQARHFEGDAGGWRCKAFYACELRRGKGIRGQQREGTA